MSTHSGPDISNDGLMFAYDMGSPRKSWKGAPTTNLLYDSGIINWTIGNLIASVSRTTIVENSVYRITSTTAGSFRLVVPLAKLTNGLSYNLSYKYKFISGGTVFSMTDWNDGSLFNVVNQTLPEYLFSSAYGTRATYDSTYRFMDFSISANTVVEIWDVQLEQNTFATPFVNGIRSNTQAILDLTNNNTITATSLTYASDGTFSFNGSSDYLSIPNTTLGNGNIAWTVSCWMKTTTTTNVLGGGSVLSNISGGPVYSMLGVNNGKIVYWTYQSGAWAQKLGIGKTVNDGNWHMLTWVNYTNYTMDMYVDGALDSNVANSISGNNNPVDVIGRSWAAYFPGSIGSLTRYNRALTAAEVQQNFNALRGRFGI
jgi:hypothetical protein